MVECAGSQGTLDSGGSHYTGEEHQWTSLEEPGVGGWDTSYKGSTYTHSHERA